MKPTRKLITTTLAATALFAALSSSATAGRFELSNQRIRVVFTPLVPVPPASLTVSCTVTLEGSFHTRTFAKTAGLLIGYITRAIVDLPNCRSTGLSTEVKAEAVRTSLPWHFQIRRLLRRPTRRKTTHQVHQRQIPDLLRVPILGTCSYTASPNYIVTGPAGGGINEGNAFLTAENGIRIRGEPATCPELTFSGRTAMTLLGTTTAITIRLI